LATGCARSVAVLPLHKVVAVVAVMSAAVPGRAVAAHARVAGWCAQHVGRRTAVLRIVAGPRLRRRRLDLRRRFVGAGQVRIGHAAPLRSGSATCPTECRMSVSRTDLPKTLLSGPDFARDNSPIGNHRVDRWSKIV